MRRVFPQLRFAAAILLSGVLVACSYTEECPLCHRVEPNQPICAPADNIAVCFFAASNPQGDHSPEPVRDAVKDALTLPLEELRIRRYADYQMKPHQWTFEEVIGHAFAGGAMNKYGEIIDTGSKGFIEAVKQPEVIPVLEKLLADLEEGVREYKELETLRHQNEIRASP